MKPRRSPGKYLQFTVRLSEATYRRLSLAAHKSRRSLNGEVDYRIGQSFELEDRDDPQHRSAARHDNAL